MLLDNLLHAATQHRSRLIPVSPQLATMTDRGNDNRHTPHNAMAATQAAPSTLLPPTTQAPPRTFKAPPAAWRSLPCTPTQTPIAMTTGTQTATVAAMPGTQKKPPPPLGPDTSPAKKPPPPLNEDLIPPRPKNPPPKVPAKKAAAPGLDYVPPSSHAPPIKPMPTTKQATLEHTPAPTQTEGLPTYLEGTRPINQVNSWPHSASRAIARQRNPTTTIQQHAPPSQDNKLPHY